MTETLKFVTAETPELDALQQQLDELQRNWREPEPTDSFRFRQEDYVTWSRNVMIRRRLEFSIRSKMVESEEIIRCSHLTVSALVGAREYAKIIADRWESMMIEQGISPII